jgi:hypothetical protein
VTGMTVASEAAVRLVDEIARHGRGPAETGGFLLAQPADRDHLTVLALAGDRGIERGRDLFKVSGGAIERLFTWAGDRDLLIRAQVHSHRRGAFLSATDLRHGFAVEGFITAVVPTYSQPPRDPDDWAWWICNAGHWDRAGAPSLVPGAGVVVRFDADGVHAT